MTVYQRLTRLFSPKKEPSLVEFTAQMAILGATIALSIDAMLPALPQIAADLTPDNVNRAQLVLTIFVAGMGLGTLFAGPLSDAFGRKRTVAFGFGLYILGALAAALAQSLEMLLLARFVQGLGGAAPRVVSVAMVRDRFEGREMARVTSFIMMVFILVPAIAPSVGAVVLVFGSWHLIFLAFVFVALAGLLWVSLRLPESLPVEKRRSMALKPLAQAAAEVMRNAEVRMLTLVMSLGFGQMFALLSSSQQIYDQTYGKVESFPRWFAAMALLSVAGTLFNARFVTRLGMGKIVRGAYLGQAVFASLYLALTLSGLLPPALQFAGFFLWSTSVFAMAGVTFGNLNAMAMRQMGHIAGMAASVIAALSTFGAVLIAAPLGLMFAGTEIPAVVGAIVCSAIAYVLMPRS